MNLVRNSEPRFELLQPDDFSQYLLREKREVAFVLRQLAAHRSMITAYYGDSGSFLTTSVVGLSKDDSHIFLDLGPDEEAIKNVLACDQLLCMTQLEKIKVQFSLKALEQTQHDGFPALLAPLPKALLRLQRREYYRLALTGLDPLFCQIPLDPSGQKKMDVHLVDISGGGVGLIVSPGSFNFQPEMLFKQCSLFLPDYGQITASLRIRSVFRMLTPSGEDIVRVGCKFEDLPVAMGNTIQRYILNTERDRRARGG